MTTTVATGSGGEGREGKGRLAGNTPAAVVQAAVASGLPGELGAAVLAVTGKTRLWNSERTEIARELCGHFFDGLEHGTPPQDLLSGFGEPAGVAKLITRAKKRNRPWAWHALRRTSLAVCLLFLTACAWYGWNAFRFYTGTPTIRINVQAEINAPSLAVPLNQRAWPLYRDAQRAFVNAGFPVKAGGWEQWPRLKPGTEEWAAACRELDNLRSAVDQVKRASGMERSACVLSTRNLSGPDSLIPDGTEVGPNENPIGLGVLLPQLSIYRSHARLLCFDAIRAVHEGRSADAAGSINAMIGIARHASEDGTVISQLVSTAIAQLAFDTLNTIVRDHPGVLADAQLAGLAHTVAAFAPMKPGKPDSWRVDLSLERRAFDDILQRFYTDDGHGDGRLCQGMTDYEVEFGVAVPQGAKFFNPLLAGIVAGRRETRDLYNQWLDKFEVENAKLLFARDRSELDRDLEEARSGLGVKYSLAALMVPAIGHAQNSLDIAHTVRDATAAGIAVELYRRKQGRYPTSWSELVPAWIPAAPTDPWSGRPLVLKPGAGPEARPLIYSIGADKIDDGGVIGTPWDVISAWSSATVPTINGPIPTRDWVIWPKPEPTGEQPRPGPVPASQPQNRGGFKWGWLGALTGHKH